MSAAPPQATDEDAPSANVPFGRRGPGYLPELDGLRTFAVGLVIWYHFPRGLIGDDAEQLIHTFHPGPRGVMLFFVLSGFLITRLLVHARQTGVPLRAFYVRRVMRIFPSYYLLLLVCALLDPHRRLIPCFFYYANFYSIEGGDMAYLGHTWSLSVEEHFYLFWPFLLRLAPARIAGRIGLAVLLAMFAFSTHYYFARFGGQALKLGTALYQSTGTQVIGLAFGATLAFGEGLLRGRLRVALLPAVGYAGLYALSTWTVLGLLGIGRAIKQSGLTEAANWIPFFAIINMAASSAAIVALVVALSGRRGSPVRWLGARPLVHLGVLSYGIYLYHLPLVALVGWQALNQDGPQAWRMSLIYFPLVYLVSLASHRLYERPLMQLGRVWAKRWFPASKH